MHVNNFIIYSAVYFCLLQEIPHTSYQMKVFLKYFLFDL